MSRLNIYKKSSDKWLAVIHGENEHGLFDCPLCNDYTSRDYGISDSICLSQPKGLPIACVSSDFSRTCPISTITGQGQCRGTPYEKWSFHQEMHLEAGEMHRGVHCPECLSIAEEFHQWLLDHGL